MADPNAGPANSGTQSMAPSTITKLPARDGASVLKLAEPLDEKNWSVWKERIKRAFRLCGVEGYANGTIKRPNNADIEQATNWDYNDNYAQFVIVNNVASSEMVHIGQCATAHEIWLNLEAVHESKGHQTAIAITRNLFRQVAEENTNIIEHLSTLKTYWERLNMVGDDDFKLTDLQFKVIISSSLPREWDQFTEPYVSGRKGEKDADLKKKMSSQQFIGILKEEYTNRQSRAPKNGGAVTNQAMTTGRSLGDRIGGTAPRNQRPSNQNRRAGSSMSCRQCGRRNHNTQDCLYLGALSDVKCKECGKFGHIVKQCWGTNAKSNTKTNLKRKSESANEQQVAKRKKTNEQTNATIEEVDSDEETIAFIAEEDTLMGDADDDDVTVIGDDDETVIGDADMGGIVFDESEIGQYSSFDDYDGINDERVLYYDWLADSATTSHICN